MACLATLSILKSFFLNLKKGFVSLTNSLQLQASWPYRFNFSYVHPLFIHMIYLISISFLGSLLLESITVRNPTNKPKAIDILFTSASATTLSGLSTVEMEVYSNPQLIVLIVIMLSGGEVLTSTLALLFKKAQLKRQLMARTEPTSLNQIELSITDHVESGTHVFRTASFLSNELKYNSVRQLSFVITGFLVFLHVAGFISILLYISLVSSARDVLKEKEINMWTFSVFTMVSSFSNTGFIPTNENMLVFRKNTGLLWIIISQVLLGNTLFPPCLRFIIWILKRLTKRIEFDYLLKSSENIGYHHLFPYLHSLLLALTVVGFLLIQLILICSMEWHSEALAGLSSYQKIVGALFLSVNARHAGESTTNLSQLSSATLVLLVPMMYLPPYTAFIPVEDKRYISNTESRNKKGLGLIRSLLMSQLSYLTIFVILICISERRKLSEDPLNFNVLNIVVEVISAYGNVGLSTGYSCDLQLRPSGSCKDAWYAFVGKWSTQGKIILTFVMFFGRLKKFSMDGGKAWKLV